MRRQVHVTRLVPSCVTRARGEEAARSLLPMFTGARPIEVDLSGVEMVSLSFLDGLLSYLCRLGKERKVIFHIDNPDVEDKLARIAGIRDIPIYYCYSEQEAQPVEPKSRNFPKATLTLAKNTRC